MQAASDERKNIAQEEVRNLRFRDDADIPAGLDRLDLILEADQEEVRNLRFRLEADAKRNTERAVIAEIKQRLDNIDAMIAYMMNMLDEADDIDDDDEDFEPFGPDDDPHGHLEIPPPDGWEPDFDDDLDDGVGLEGHGVEDGVGLEGHGVEDGVGRLPHGLDPNREQWRDIDGFPNYEVSHYGNVRNKTTGGFLRPFANQNGYLRVDLRHAGKRKKHCVHVLVADAWIPKIDGKSQIDHIDRNKANNLLYNLRRCTPEENMWNRGMFRNNTTGVTGVTRCGDKYRAEITANRRKHYLGLFDTLEEAAAVRRRAEVELHGAFARG